MTFPIVMLAVLFVLLLMSVPVGIACALVGFVSLAVTAGDLQAIFALGSAPYTVLASSELAVLPVFILMGYFITHSGAVTAFFDVAKRRLRRVPGVIGLSTLGAGGIFAGASGTSVADVLVLTPAALPELRRTGYRDSLASGLIANVGCLAALIPPSFPFVIYGLSTETRLDQLLLSGLGPAALMFVGFALIVLLNGPERVRRRPPPPVAPVAATEQFEGVGAARAVRDTVFSDVRRIAPLAVMVLAFPVGLYSGLVTVEETATVIAAVALLYMVLMARESRVRKAASSFTAAVRTFSTVAIVIAGTAMLSTFMTSVRLPQELAQSIADSGWNRYLVLAAILVLYLVLGTVVDALAILLITLPLTFPTVLALGFDPIWFGAICVLMIEIAVVMPPHGMNLMALKARAPDVAWRDLYLGVWKFVAVDVVVIVLIIMFPQIVLFIPQQFAG
ncbi:TRAP transporter large permease [Actinophytocola sp.]|uniref:TRAP transporter large permease n=1 Tax=Actinophytocola sp. TaxID=1872138 RepID=UPI003D6A6C65